MSILPNTGPSSRYMALATRALKLADLSEEAIAALADAQMDPRHDRLNALMDDGDRSGSTSNPENPGGSRGPGLSRLALSGQD